MGEALGNGEALGELATACGGAACGAEPESDLRIPVVAIPLREQTHGASVSSLTTRW